MPFDNVRFKECSVINDEYASGKYVFGTLGKLFARFLIRFPITPNQLTWFWGGLMVISSLLYSTGKWEFSILGGIIWIIAYSLDYSDGIIARYKNQKSSRGAYIDMIIHRVTYPLLMFCIGYGAYLDGGLPFFDFTWFKDVYYIFFGVAAGISMSVFMDITPLYEKYKVGEKTFEDNKGSIGVEGNLVKNKDLFKKLMNFNPLVFTNMMIMLLVFACLDIMGWFIILYGIGYSLATVARILLVYVDL